MQTAKHNLVYMHARHSGHAWHSNKLLQHHRHQNVTGRYVLNIVSVCYRMFISNPIWLSYCQHQSSVCHSNSDLMIPNIKKYIQISFTQWGIQFLNLGIRASWYRIGNLRYQFLGKKELYWSSPSCSGLLHQLHTVWKALLLKKPTERSLFAVWRKKHKNN